MKSSLILGDCLEKMAEIPDGSVDMVITSPPYFNARDYSNFSTFDVYIEFLMRFISESVRVVRDGGFICVNTSAVLTPRAKRSERSQRHNIPAEICYMMRDLWFIEEIIWKKPEGAASGRARRFHVDKNPTQFRCNPDTERVAIYQKPSSRLNDFFIKQKPDYKVNIDIGYSEVWEIQPSKSKLHSAVFPIDIPSRLISLYSWPRDTILDPFMGSGTTGVACKNLNRDFIGIELDPGYFEIAKERIEAA